MKIVEDWNQTRKKQKTRKIVVFCNLVDCDLADCDLNVASSIFCSSFLSNRLSNFNFMLLFSVEILFICYFNPLFSSMKTWCCLSNFNKYD